MTTIANAYINALLADAAYIDILSGLPLDSGENLKRLADRLTMTRHKT